MPLTTWSCSSLGFLVCSELAEGRIAIIGIGNSDIFRHLHSIADSLKIPYISIRWETFEEENQTLEASLNAATAFSSNSFPTPPLHPQQLMDEDESGRGVINQISMHPPARRLMKAVIDLIDYYKWEYVTILYQESTGIERIEDLIRLQRHSVHEYNTMLPHHQNKLRLQVRQLSKDVDKWLYLIKDVKLSGSSHIIVDVETKYLNTFLQQVCYT